MQILFPITATSQNIKILHINYGGWPLYCKSFRGYISTIYCPINAKFGTKKQDHVDTQFGKTDAILKMVLSPYLSWESSIFNEIWCADADSRSKNGHVTKYQNLQIQNGGRPPYWKSFMATSQRLIVRLMRNLVWGSTIMFDTGRLTKYQISCRLQK